MNEVTTEPVKTLAESIKEFIAENPDDMPSTVADEDAETEASDDTTSDDEHPAEADESEGDEPAEAKPALDTEALTQAIESGDPAAFIEALGEHAEALLGAKAHKALRKQASENKKTTKRANDIANALAAKFGDPIAARNAAESGNIDAFVDSVEKWFGAPWQDCLKAVNAAFAGKPARIAAKQEEDETVVKQQEAAKTEAQTKVKRHITDTLGKSDAKLMKEYPQVVELVFAKMQTEFNKGVNTPAKALKLVKEELQAQAKVLSKLFAGDKPTPKRNNIRPPSEDRSPNGRPMTDAELREEILRAEGLWRKK
jgi:hypothetical protein